MNRWPLRTIDRVEAIDARFAGEFAQVHDHGTVGRILGVRALVADMENRGTWFSVISLELQFAGRDLVRNFFSIDRDTRFPDDWRNDRWCLLLGFGWCFGRWFRFVCSEAYCVKDDKYGSQKSTHAGSVRAGMSFVDLGQPLSEFGFFGGVIRVTGEVGPLVRIILHIVELLTPIGVANV